MLSNIVGYLYRKVSEVKHRMLEEDFKKASYLTVDPQLILYQYQVSQGYQENKPSASSI